MCVKVLDTRDVGEIHELFLQRRSDEGMEKVRVNQV